MLLGLAAAGVVIAILPRLYSYPKILAFPLTLLALWRYVDTPSIGRLAGLAATVVFAFLLRHDFGVYTGVASAAIVLVTPHPLAIRRSLIYAAIGLVLVAPYFAWLASIGRLGGTGSSGFGKTLEMATGGDVARPSLSLDLSHGVVHIDPRLATVAVRWSANADSASRREAEQRYGLIDAVDQGSGTFAYGLTDVSISNRRALVNDPLVEDTSGLSRQTLELDGSLLDRWVRRLPTSRVVWGPFFDAPGAGVWLYYFIWVIPFAALVRLAWKWARRIGAPAGTVGPFPDEARKVGGAALLGILLNLYLIRGSFDSRLQDVIVPAAIVAAWLCREYLDWLRASRGVAVRSLLATIGVALVILFWVSLTTMESTASVARLATAAFRFAPLRKAATELSQRPLDFYAPAGAEGIKKLTRYVHECVPAGERVLLVAYEPQVFYYSERLFAGGMEYFHQGRFSSPDELAETVERLSHQPVPMVIIERTRAEMFRDVYKPVFDYVGAKYHRAATSTFVDNRTWDLFVENTRAVAGTREDEVPCFQ
jgi:hypothetical protein